MLAKQSIFLFVCLFSRNRGEHEDFRINPYEFLAKSLKSPTVVLGGKIWCLFESPVNFQSLGKIINSQTAEVKGSRRLTIYINGQDNEPWPGVKQYREN